MLTVYPFGTNFLLVALLTAVMKCLAKGHLRKEGFVSAHNAKVWNWKAWAAGHTASTGRKKEEETEAIALLAFSCPHFRLF